MSLAPDLPPLSYTSPHDHSASQNGFTLEIVTSDTYKSYGTVYPSLVDRTTLQRQVYYIMPEQTQFKLRLTVPPPIDEDVSRYDSYVLKIYADGKSIGGQKDIRFVHQRMDKYYIMIDGFAHFPTDRTVVRQMFCTAPVPISDDSKIAKTVTEQTLANLATFRCDVYRAKQMEDPKRQTIHRHEREGAAEAAIHHQHEQQIAQIQKKRIKSSPTSSFSYDPSLPISQHNAHQYRDIHPVAVPSHLTNKHKFYKFKALQTCGGELLPHHLQGHTRGRIIKHDALVVSLILQYDTLERLELRGLCKRSSEIFAPIYQHPLLQTSSMPMPMPMPMPQSSSASPSASANYESESQPGAPRNLHIQSSLSPSPSPSLPPPPPRDIHIRTLRRINQVPSSARVTTSHPHPHPHPHPLPHPDATSHSQVQNEKSSPSTSKSKPKKRAQVSHSHSNKATKKRRIRR